MIPRIVEVENTRFLEHFIILGVLVSVLIALLLSPAHADVRLQGLFTDNMVLQQKKKVPVWGWADPGEKVAVTLDGGRYRTIADAKGQWIVRLEPLTADRRILKMTVTGKNTITLKNIVVGEVWLASGQSNMDMELAPARKLKMRKGTLNYNQEIAKADYPFIRIYSSKPIVSRFPTRNCWGQWEVCCPQTIGYFSAVAYFFGRNIYTRLNVPVGLIKSSAAGARIEEWISTGKLEEAGYKDMVEEWEKSLKKYDFYNELAKYKQRLVEYEKALSEGRIVNKPAKPSPPNKNLNGPSYLYNGMIAPLIPFAIQGVIWYQGESDVHNAYAYRALFPAMIRNWREDWGQGDFPFLFVQLANYEAQEPAASKKSSWPELREAQLLALEEPNTAMAVTIDIGEAGNIHPRNKQEVGRRLALAARALAYGERIVYSGPIYKSMVREGDRICLYFDHVGSGLTADNPDSLHEFVISGKNRKFVKALARIEGNRVVVWCDQISEPVAIRYAWKGNPEKASLRNEEGLPASPFRTDEWPGITRGKR